MPAQYSKGKTPVDLLAIRATKSDMHHYCTHSAGNTRLSSSLRTHALCAMALIHKITGIPEALTVACAAEARWWEVARSCKAAAV